MAEGEMKRIAFLIFLPLVSCVTTVSPDGTKTTSFAPTAQQIDSTAGLVRSVASPRALTADPSIADDPFVGPVQRVK